MVSRFSKIIHGCLFIASIEKLPLFDITDEQNKASKIRDIFFYRSSSSNQIFHALSVVDSC